MAFVNAVSDLRNAADHHPDLVVGWGRCIVAWSTHDAGGITQNDCRVRGAHRGDRTRPGAM